MNAWIEVITNVGFPIAVALYLLIYFRKTIDSLKDVISQNTAMMSRLMDRLEKHE